MSIGQYSLSNAHRLVQEELYFREFNARVALATMKTAVQFEETAQYVDLVAAKENFEERHKDLNDALNDKKAFHKMLETLSIFSNSLSALIDYHRKLETLVDEPTKISEKREFEQTKKIFSSTLDDFGEAITTFIKEESSHYEVSLTAAIRPACAVRELLTDIVEFLQDLSVPGLDDMQAHLLSIAQTIEQKRRVFEERWQLCFTLRASHPNRFPRLLFGGAEWQERYQARPRKAVGLLDRTLRCFDSENWSSTTKDVVYRLLAAAQLFSHGTLFMNQLNLDTLQRQARGLQRQVIDAVPQEQSDEINKQTAHLGVFLSDKYDAAQFVSHFGKGRTEAFKTALRQAKAQFGENAPSAAEALTFINAYRIQELVKASPIANPTQSLSTREWWRVFSASEDVSGICAWNETTPYCDSPPAEPGIMTKLASYISKQSETLIQEEKSLGLARLRDIGLHLANIQKEIVGEILSSETDSQLRTAQAALSKLREDRPTERSSLTKFLTWKQSVEDLTQRILDTPYPIIKLQHLLDTNPKRFLAAIAKLESLLVVGEPYTHFAETVLRKKLQGDYTLLEIGPLCRLLANLGKLQDISKLLTEIESTLLKDFTDNYINSNALELFKSMVTHKLTSAEFIKNLLNWTVHAYPRVIHPSTIIDILRAPPYALVVAGHTYGH